MKNKAYNSTTYILYTELWFLISAYFYNHELIRCLPNCDIELSKVIFLMATFIASLIGAVISSRFVGNGINIFANIALPISIFTYIVYWHNFVIPAWFIAILAVAISIAYVSLVITLKPSSGKEIPMKRRLIKAALGVRVILPCVLTIFVAVVAISLKTGLISSKPQISESDIAETDNMTISENIETVSKLSEDTWQQLSEKEKLDVLNFVIGIETQYLGLSGSPELKADVLPSNDELQTAALYRESENSITIDISQLESADPYMVLESICHEMYHAYQRAICTIYLSVPDEYKNIQLFNKAKKYADDLMNYENGMENYELYLDQDYEKDARDYALKAVLEYYVEIEKYLNPDSIS